VALESKARSVSVPVDVIRTLAIFLVIMLHASIEPTPGFVETAQQATVHFWAMNVYNSLSRVSVPLFVMLSGALLLQPFKNEPLGVFLKKRFRRIGPAFVFWGVAYFAWRTFVNGETLTVNSVVQGILQGSYFHFWFLYMIIGLYLITPLLRLFVDHADLKVLKYIIVLWFVGVAINPLIGAVTGYRIDTNVFVIAGWLGYFLLGVYLQKERVRSRFLVAVMVLGYVWTMLGSWVLTYTVGGDTSYFFYDFLTANIILTSAALFQLLLTVSPDFFTNRFQSGGTLVSLISKYTLPVYLFHVMILESFEKGYFGFKLSVTTLNPFVEIPLITVVTLFISVGVIFLLKKVPIVKEIIG
jgi:surface polysaccharide O-acyltransferase-like enzyme